MGNFFLQNAVNLKSLRKFKAVKRCLDYEQTEVEEIPQENEIEARDLISHNLIELKV